MKFKTIFINLAMATLVSSLILILNSFGYLDYNFTKFQFFIMAILIWMFFNQTTLPQTKELKCQTSY